MSVPLTFASSRKPKSSLPPASRPKASSSRPCRAWGWERANPLLLPIRFPDARESGGKIARLVAQPSVDRFCRKPFTAFYLLGIECQGAVRKTTIHPDVLLTCFSAGIDFEEPLRSRCQAKTYFLFKFSHRAIIILLTRTKMA